MSCLSLKISLNKAFLIMKQVNLKYKDGFLVVEHLSSYGESIDHHGECTRR